ncbi:MAG: ABC transporter permease [Gemmatimonadetes bacterium]|nr:ABC transporter permease [Gemmatimonadota bacterium]
MNLSEAIRATLWTIRTQKMRAFFTVLGTVMGVTFLIAVITLIEGMNSYMEKQVAAQIFGFNTATLSRRPSINVETDPAIVREYERRPRLTFADAEWLAARMETPGFFTVVSQSFGQVRGPDGTTVDRVMVSGASGTYFRVRDLAVEEGRIFTEDEADRGQPVVVIGREVADRLFEETNPVGRTVWMAGTPFRVVGVLEKQGSVLGLSMDNVAIAPVRSAINGSVKPRNSADQIIFKVPEPDLLAPAVAEIEGLMRIRRRLHPDTDNDFEVETPDAAIGFWKRFSGIILVALPALVGISLLVGAVVIMNIMLVAVTERTREIGLRKSLGAKPRDILLQFLVEAGTLSGAGGVLGIAAGAGLAALVAAVSPLPARLAPWSVALSLALAVGVGLAAGVYPAQRAARLDPITALRKD